MLTDEIKRYIDKSVLCWLATASREGVPNVSPKEIFTHYGQNLLIADIASPQSIKNIMENDNVCISFIDILIQMGWQLKGKATIIDSGHLHFNLLLQPLTQMTKGKFPINNIISVQIEKTKPIFAPSYILYPDTTEEEQIKSAIKAYKL